MKTNTSIGIFDYREEGEDDEKIKYSAPQNYSMVDPDWDGKRNHFGETMSNDNNLDREDMLDAGVTWRQPL